MDKNWTRGRYRKNCHFWSCYWSKTNSIGVGLVLWQSCRSSWRQAFRGDPKFYGDESAEEVSPNLETSQLDFNDLKHDRTNLIAYTGQYSGDARQVRVAQLGAVGCHGVHIAHIKTGACVKTLKVHHKPIIYFYLTILTLLLALRVWQPD